MPQTDRPVPKSDHPASPVGGRPMPESETVAADPQGGRPMPEGDEQPTQ